MNIKCEKCGVENEDGAKFCKDCGSALNSEPVLVVEQTSANKYKKPLLIVAGVLILSVVGYFGKIALKEYNKTIGKENRCNNNDAEACDDIAFSYKIGLSDNNMFFSLPKDTSKAIEYFTKACNLDNFSACATLGREYSMGNIVRQDRDKAVELFTKAANGGDAGGYSGLGSAYQFGSGGVAQNSAYAKELYGKACDLGDKLSCLEYSSYHPNPVIWESRFSNALKYADPSSL